MIASASCCDCKRSKLGAPHVWRQRGGRAGRRAGRQRSSRCRAEAVTLIDRLLLLLLTLLRGTVALRRRATELAPDRMVPAGGGAQSECRPSRRR